MKEKKFSFRGFISFSLFISFVVITITGVVLYLTPPGRVAKWVNWEMIGLTKEEWQAQHTLFSLFFFVLSIFHIFSMNWRTFLHYIKKKAASNFNMKKEMIFSVVFSLLFFLCTLYQVPPFQTVMDFGEYLTESWEKTDEKAPMAHAELLKVGELSEKVFEKLTTKEIIDKLNSAGIKGVTKDKTLTELGTENSKSPFELFTIISKNQEIKKIDTSSLLKPGSGIGRKTLSEVAEIAGLDISKVLLVLKEKGIEASADEKIKDLAEKAQLSPIEFMKLILE